MSSDYKDSDDRLLSPLTIQALQEYVKSKDTESFKELCQSEISEFHLYAKGKTSDWNKFVGYIESNFSGIYPHLVTDALIDFLTQHEFYKQSSNGSVKLPYPLSNVANFLLHKENIEAKVAQVIENLVDLENRFSPDFTATLYDCVSNNNPQAFGTFVRSEFVFSRLYQEGKDQELSYLLEYLQSNFSNEYFDASIQSVTNFLIQQQFFREATDGEIQTSLNSICQSLAIAGEVESKAKAMMGIASHLETIKQPQKKKGLLFEEITSQRKIIEKRKVPGQLKVFASWYFIWNTIHQIAWDLIFATVICNTLIICTSSNPQMIRASRALLAVCTSIVHIKIRMDNTAKKRWSLKYLDTEHKGKSM
jgi:hypothetical protein